MKIINSDYKSYIDSMDNKDLVIIDITHYPKYLIDIDFIFSKIKCKYLLIYINNSIMVNVFRANHYTFAYKTCLTLCNQCDEFGIIKNHTNHILFFTRNKEKSLGLQMRNVYFGDDKEELIFQILNNSLKRGNNDFSYIFCGLDVLKLNIFDKFNIDCVDMMEYIK